jgi:hypothetical protein
MVIGIDMQRKQKTSRAVPAPSGLLAANAAFD